jgi:hypothetical protein
MAEFLGGLVEALKWKSVGRNSQVKPPLDTMETLVWANGNASSDALGEADGECTAVQLFHGVPLPPQLEDEGTRTKMGPSRNVSAIRWYHRVLTWYEPEMDAGFPSVMRTLKRLSRPVGRNIP